VNGQYIYEVSAKGKILDIGCSYGVLLQILREKGGDVYGVETNLRFVKICREKGLNVIYGTLKDAKYPNSFFDIIILSQVIEHVPSPTEILKEVWRILRPGGRVFIYCPNADSYLRKIFGKYWHGWHIPFHFYAFTEVNLPPLSRQNFSGYLVHNQQSSSWS